MSSNPFNIPQSQKEVFNRQLADFQNELPEAGPFLRNSFVYAILAACAGRNYDNYDLVQQVLFQLFLNTATGEFLRIWGDYKKINPLPGQPSSGVIIVTGLNLSPILVGSEFQTSDGKLFKTQATAAIGVQNNVVTSLTRSGNTVTATTSGNHLLATSAVLNITGANQVAYNGQYPIVVTAPNQFTYTIVANAQPSTPATGTIMASIFAAQLQVVSEQAGSGYNLASGTELTPLVPISGIDSLAYVTFDGITGGLDSESDDRYRERVIYSYQNPSAPFNIADITSICREILFVKNVFVQPVTPSVGQVTIFFSKDISTGSTLPTSNEAQIVRQYLLDKAQPAHVAASSIHLDPPVARIVNFNFTSLVPNTVAMQNAIRANLKALFNNDVAVDQDLVQPAYESAIYQTIDPTSGASVRVYTLASPVGTISVASNELPVLGDITFNFT